MDINSIELWLITAKLPETLRLSHAETITNLNDFFKNHIGAAKAHEADTNPRGKYYRNNYKERLIKAIELIEKQGT